MKNHFSSKFAFANAAAAAAPLLLVLLFGGVSSSQAAPILWNRLGSNAQVLNSDLGPNLSFYAGGFYPDVIGNPGYVPGVFGNALTIAPGSYGTPDREHNVVWNNLNSYLSAEHGTIEVWYKQNENPVGFSHGVYRIFDGSYGLSSGLQLDSETVPDTRLYFGLQFDGAYSGVSYDISSLNGTWMHIGAVWDRAGIAGSGDKLRLYINGSIAAASTVGGWGTVVGTQADIGGGNDANIAGKFAVDNLKVYDNAVTDFSGRFIEAVPEPTTATLVILGGIAVLRRRRRV
jgi:hypothetical protein